MNDRVVCFHASVPIVLVWGVWFDLFLCLFLSFFIVLPSPASSLSLSLKFRHGSASLCSVLCLLSWFIHSIRIISLLIPLSSKSLLALFGWFMSSSFHFIRSFLSLLGWFPFLSCSSLHDDVAGWLWLYFFSFFCFSLRSVFIYLCFGSVTLHGPSLAFLSVPILIFSPLSFFSFVMSFSRLFVRSTFCWWSPGWIHSALIIFSLFIPPPSSLVYAFSLFSFSFLSLAFSLSISFST